MRDYCSHNTAREREKRRAAVNVPFRKRFDVASVVFKVSFEQICPSSHDGDGSQVSEGEKNDSEEMMVRELRDLLMDNFDSKKVR